MGKSNYRLPDHRFWRHYDRWEPDTLGTYERFVGSGDVVLDVGAWIGPTLIFADACGAGRIVAVEPNPSSRRHLDALFVLNPGLARKTTLLPLAICPGRETIRLGQPKEDKESSLFGIRGDEITVPCMSIVDLIAGQMLARIDLLKIDMEGAECLLADDLRCLSQGLVRHVHLSLHPPFWRDDANPEEFVTALTGFDIQDDRGERLPPDQLLRRLTTDRKYPDWGTRHGNFFEVILSAKS